MADSLRALLVALGIDNFGSGLFLPLTLVYATQVVGLPLAVAGVAATVGTMAGLVVPPVAGRFVDRVGPRPVVIASQVVQGFGAAMFLVADGVVGVGVAVCALAAGQQLFYSSLFALIADVVGDGQKDRPFAVVSMVRSACFGLGGLAAAGLLTFAGTDGLRVAVAVNVVSFVGCALLLALRVRAPHIRHPETTTGPRLRDDRNFLAYIGIVALVALSMDFFLMGVPVFVLDSLAGPAWLPGTILALHTVLTSACGTLAVRVTDRLTRTTTLAIGALLVVVWCAVFLAATVVPVGWTPVVLLPAAVLTAASAVFFGARVNALAVLMAPAEARGRFLAAFQYAFTVPGVLAPAVVALFTVGVWLPWLVVAACSAVAAVALRRLGTRLPAEALNPASAPVR